MKNENVNSVNEQTLPYSIEAEQAVLGAILSDPSCIPEVNDILSSHSFFLPKHSAIYETILSMTYSEGSIDIATVLDRLKSEGFQGDETEAYLSELMKATPAASDISSCARIVESHYCTRDEILRIIIAPLIQYQDPSTALDVADRVGETVYPWASDCLIPDFTSWKDHLPDEQITWLGDDCIKLAKTLADKAFPSLLPGIAVAINSLGTDNPVVLADGIFEYAKSKVCLFEASLFTFVVIQLLRGDQFAFKS